VHRAKTFGWGGGASSREGKRGLNLWGKKRWRREDFPKPRGKAIEVRFVIFVNKDCHRRGEVARKKTEKTCGIGFGNSLRELAQGGGEVFAEKQEVKGERGGSPLGITEGSGKGKTMIRGFRCCHLPCTSKKSRVKGVSSKKGFLGGGVRF